MSKAPFPKEEDGIERADCLGSFLALMFIPSGTMVPKSEVHCFLAFFKRDEPSFQDPLQRILPFLINTLQLDFPGDPVDKNPPASAGGLGLIPVLGRSPEKETATHSNVLAWEIPWPEEPNRPQSIGFQRGKQLSD